MGSPSVKGMARQPQRITGERIKVALIVHVGFGLAAPRVVLRFFALRERMEAI